MKDAAVPTNLPDDLSPATLAVQAGRPPRTPGGPLNQPVVLASTYVAGAEVGYARSGNPTWEAFEAAVGALEGGRSLSFSSGMGAASCVFDLLPPGAVVVAPHGPYAEVLQLLRTRSATGALSVRHVEPGDSHAVAAACDGADLVWLEAPSNPLLVVPDLASAAAAARAAGALLVVDATFATPLRLRPLDVGAHVVVHSATKFISGHSDLLLGVATTRDDSLHERLVERRTMLGSVAPPFEAWLALRGLRTLALRVERSEANARVLVERLRTHPAIELVRYPGWGAMVSIEVTGGAAAADAVSDAVRLWAHATSLGGVESSLERRRRWPNEPVEVPENLVRMSVGIEDVDDLWDDLSAALDGR